MDNLLGPLDSWYWIFSNSYLWRINRWHRVHYAAELRSVICGLAPYPNNWVFLMKKEKDSLAKDVLFNMYLILLIEMKSKLGVIDTFKCIITFSNSL